MTTALISDNCLVNRSYAGNINRHRSAERMLLDIPQHIHLSNLFPFTQLHGAIASFDEQLEKNSNRLNNINPEDLIRSFAKILVVLLEINTSAIHTQITSSNSLVVKAETAKENVYAEIFFDDITGWVGETVVNIFHNKELQFNNSGLLDAMILAIKQYFGNEEINYFTILNQATAYDLSGTALATTEF